MKNNTSIVNVLNIKIKKDVNSIRK